MNIKELQKKQDKELENNLIEYDGIWHRRNKDNTCELFTMADLRSIISKVRRETAEKILRKIKKRRNEALNLKGYHPANAETARRHIDGLDVAIKLLDQILKELKGGE